MHELQVRDMRPVVSDSGLLLRRLDGIEAGAHGAIAYRVHVNLQAQPHEA